MTRAPWWSPQERDRLKKKALMTYPSQTKTHSDIGASSMYRWAPCPGSVALSRPLPKTTNRYAAEGTCAHDLAETCEKTGADPDLFLGAKRTADGHEFTVDEEMVAGVQLYIESGIDVYEPIAGDVKYVEHKFDLSSLFPGLYGTNDRIIWKPKSRTLIVDDFKYGAGVPVEVKANKQLMYYGLGAVLQLKLPVKDIVLRIIQPRCPHPDGPVRSYMMNALDLLDFQGDLVLAAQATTRADAPLRAGDWCRFCPAAGLPCPELLKKAQEAAVMAFDVVDVKPGEPVKAIDHAKLAEALKLADVIEHWCENVRSLAYAEAERGETIPGFKLVDKRPTRQWRDVAEAEQALKAAGYGETQMYPVPELNSPAKMEKVIGKKKFESFAELCPKKSSGHALAPDSDKRPPVSRQTAAEAFANA